MGKGPHGGNRVWTHSGHDVAMVLKSLGPHREDRIQTQASQVCCRVLPSACWPCLLPMCAKVPLPGAPCNHSLHPSWHLTKLYLLPSFPEPGGSVASQPPTFPGHLSHTPLPRCLSNHFVRPPVPGLEPAATACHSCCQTLALGLELILPSFAYSSHMPSPPYPLSWMSPCSAQPFPPWPWQCWPLLP